MRHLFFHVKEKNLTWLFYKACLSGLCAKASGEDKASSPYLLIQIINWKSNIASPLHNLIGEPGQRFTFFVIPTQVYPVLLSQTLLQQARVEKNNLRRSNSMGIWFCWPEIHKNTLLICEQAYEANTTAACSQQLIKIYFGHFLDEIAADQFLCIREWEVIRIPILNFPVS